MKQGEQDVLAGMTGGGAGGLAGLLGGYAKYGHEMPKGNASGSIKHLKEGKIGRNLLMYLQKHPGLAKALKIGGIGSLAGAAGGVGLSHLMGDDEE